MGRSIGRPATWIATGILGLIALGHLLRLLFGFEVVIGGVEIPTWVSVPAGMAAAALAIFVILEARRG